jgi:cytochrome c oxidase subunit 3
MTIGLVFLTGLMAAIVWWLFRQTINVQPWKAQVAGPNVRGNAAAPRPAVKTALWVFLGVATSLFVLFVSAYAMRLSFADWTPLPRPRLLMLNTALLVGASLAMEWTVYAARRADGDNVRRGLWASGLLTFGFLAGQLFVWKQLNDAGYFVSTSAATAFFYLFTAVHGLHVLGGLVAWARASARAWRGTDPAKIRLGVELCATYWHFLLAVWVVLYALLVSEGIGLAICSSASL